MTALHRHTTAVLGARSTRLRGQGSEHARLVRMILLAYTRWPGAKGSPHPWPSNATIAARSGLGEREVERAMAALVAAGLVATKIGRRAGARKAIGRVIDVGLAAPAKVLIPEGVDVAHIWALVRSHRERPAALVTMMVGAYALASDAAGGPIEEWTDIGCTMAEWRRFVGHGDSWWSHRVRELEGLGLIRREGRRVLVSPPRVWLTLAIDKARKRSRSRQLASVRAAENRRDAPPVMDNLIEPEWFKALHTLDLPSPSMQRVEYVPIDPVEWWTATGPP